ncbi:MAG: GNAT family N-acetyltransferase [Candidatus Marinimicrobia bacterium]|nr:GNAT family N-acetyltransferase [Candidatus Neomarinimicrobiota bacterium]
MMHTINHRRSNNNENVSRYLVYTFPYPYTKQDAEWWIEIGSKANGSVTKVIEYRGEFVGGVGIKPQTGWKSHLAEIGFWVGEEYWGKGITSEALRTMSDLVFSTMKYKKLFAPVLGPNKASMRVLEKCEYNLEGVLKREVFKGGQYSDVYHYAKYCS